MSNRARRCGAWLEPAAAAGEGAERAALRAAAASAGAAFRAGRCVPSHLQLRYLDVRVASPQRAHSG